MATLSKDEARRLRAQNGQKKAMAGRKCPACGRGNALKKYIVIDGTAKKCRYCGDEKLYSIYG